MNDRSRRVSARDARWCVSTGEAAAGSPSARSWGSRSRCTRSDALPDRLPTSTGHRRRRRLNLPARSTSDRGQHPRWRWAAIRRRTQGDWNRQATRDAPASRPGIAGSAPAVHTVIGSRVAYAEHDDEKAITAAGVSSWSQNAGSVSASSPTTARSRSRRDSCADRAQEDAPTTPAARSKTSRTLAGMGHVALLRRERTPRRAAGWLHQYPPRPHTAQEDSTHHPLAEPG